MWRGNASERMEMDSSYLAGGTAGIDPRGESHDDGGGEGRITVLRSVSTEEDPRWRGRQLEGQ